MNSARTSIQILSVDLLPSFVRSMIPNDADDTPTLFALVIGNVELEQTVILPLPYSLAVSLACDLSNVVGHYLDVADATRDNAGSVIDRARKGQA